MSGVQGHIQLHRRLEGVLFTDSRLPPAVPAGGAWGLQWTNAVIGCKLPHEYSNMSC